LKNKEILTFDLSKIENTIYRTNFLPENNLKVYAIIIFIFY